MSSEDKKKQTKLDDILERQGSMRTNFHEINENTIEIDQEIEKKGFCRNTWYLKMIGIRVFA